MGNYYAIIDLAKGELLINEDGRVITYKSKELCDKYILSIEDADELEDQYSVIDVTTLIRNIRGY